MSTITIKVPNWLDLFFAWPVMLYRRWKYGCVFRKIFLGEGLYTIVDLSDYYLLNNFRWSAKRDRRNIYAVRFLNEPLKQATIVSLHRIILNSPSNLLVDHRNGHTLDNRKENLRLATRSQNVHNKCKTQSETSSRFIGVSFEKRRGRWDVRIRHEGKQIWIGSFDNEIEAAKAYDAAARKYHGEFARLNFPEETALPQRH
jgi:hypothetical protein